MILLHKVRLHGLLRVFVHARCDGGRQRHGTLCDRWDWSHRCLFPPTLQKNIQEALLLRNSAIGLIDDIMKNAKCSTHSLAPVRFAIAPTRWDWWFYAGSRPDDQEAKGCRWTSTLVEHANLLRGPLGATGFPWQEAWNALQMQRGKSWVIQESPVNC